MSHTFEELPKKIQVILQLPIITAIISFVIGTVIFSLYCLKKDTPFTVINDEIVSTTEDLLYIGTAYVVLAFLINMLVFAGLLICAFAYKKYRIPILKNTAVLLVNIPVVMLYLYLIFTI